MRDKPDWVQLAKERAEAATPGPWVREDDWMCEVNAELRDLGVGSVTYKNVVKLVDGLDRVCFRGAPDAEFIAAARSDIPRLIACVEAADALAGVGQELLSWHNQTKPEGAVIPGDLHSRYSRALAAYRTARARGGDR